MLAARIQKKKSKGKENLQWKEKIKRKKREL